MLYSLVGSFLRRLQLPLVGFVVDAVEECAEGHESEVEDEEDQNIDECHSVDEILNSLVCETI
jgi:hypothetical protein